MSETLDSKLLKEPWEIRVFDKNWKVRNDANIDLAALCNSITDPEDPRLREFGPFFEKTIADSNPAVQERALDALTAFLKATNADSARRYAKEVCEVMAEKCLTGRPKTVEKAQMVFMLLIELESIDSVLDAMEKTIFKKAPKAIVPAIDIISQALREFGAKIVPPKRILKMLAELFDHRDQNIRALSKGLALELCRWIGKETVKSVLFEKMLKAMKQELEAELVSVSGIARPSRKIRSEQDKVSEQELVSEVAGYGREESVADAPQGIDKYQKLGDSADKSTPKTARFKDGVKAAKWSKEKEKGSGVKCPRLNSHIAPYRVRILQSLEKCLNDETPEVRDAASAELEAMAKKWVPEMKGVNGGGPVRISSVQNFGERNSDRFVGGSSPCRKRILRELKFLQEDPLTCWSADKVSGNMFHFEARIMGDPDCPYADGAFLVDIHFPGRYPLAPPKVAFRTKVFHPNVDIITGDIYIGILDPGNWSPATTMPTVLRSICSMLKNPEPAYFFMPKIAEMYNTDRSEYERTARSWTLMYAMT